METANAKLTDSLFTLVQSLKTLQADNTLSKTRKALGAAATGARKAVKDQRAAAYPSASRKCSTVAEEAVKVRTFAAQGAAARQVIGAKAATLNADITSLDTATKAVTSAQKALATSLKGLSNPPSTVATAEVAAALKEAAGRRADVASAVESVTSASAEAGKTFDKLTRQSATIASDACP